MNPVPVLDMLAFVGFSLALTATTRIPVSDDSPVSRMARGCLATACAVYVFAMGSNVLEHTGVTSAFDPIEDYVEILFPCFVLYAVYTLFLRQREREMSASQRAAQRSHEMMLGIVDAAPAGILLLDTGGRIVFANDAAKRVLDLIEDDCGALSPPGWRVRIADGEERSDLLAVVESGTSGTDVPVTFSWPTGWRIEVVVRTEHLGDDVGRVGGVVATFLPPVSRP